MFAIGNADTDPSNRVGVNRASEYDFAVKHFRNRDHNNLELHVNWGCLRFTIFRGNWPGAHGSLLRCVVGCCCTTRWPGSLHMWGRGIAPVPTSYFPEPF